MATHHVHHAHYANTMFITRIMLNNVQVLLDEKISGSNCKGYPSNWQKPIPLTPNLSAVVLREL